jgi:hypothetical protein
LPSTLEFSPVPELFVVNSSLTLFFLRSRKVLFFDKQTDPLFETNGYFNFTDNGMSANIHYRYWPTAAALGCIDAYEVCVPVGHNGAMECYNVTNNMTSDDQHSDSPYLIPDPGLPAELGLSSNLFALLSYKDAELNNVITTINTQALDAWNKKLNRAVSVGLSKVQWEIEAERLFQILLARYQLNMFWVVRGERRLGDGAAKVDPLSNEKIVASRYKKTLCNNVKIGGTGWKNISLFWFVVLLTFSISVALGSIELGETLVSEHAWTGICFVLKSCFTAVMVPAYIKLSSSLPSGFRQAKRHFQTLFVFLFRRGSAIPNRASRAHGLRGSANRTSGTPVQHEPLRYLHRASKPRPSTPLSTPRMMGHD